MLFLRSIPSISWSILVTTVNPLLVLTLVGIYQIPSWSWLLAHRKSTFISDYLSGCRCVLPARNLQPAYLVTQQLSHQLVPLWTDKFRLTIWLEWTRALLILFTKWTEFLTFDEDLRVSGPMISTRKWLHECYGEPRLLTMVLNGIPSLFILEGHICAIACCNAELAVCILFMVWDLFFTGVLWQLSFCL